MVADFYNEDFRRYYDFTESKEEPRSIFARCTAFQRKLVDAAKETL